ncbi:hypothetical protein CBL_20024 [Carabus blaptoides fortunei]
MLILVSLLIKQHYEMWIVYITRCTLGIVVFCELTSTNGVLFKWSHLYKCIVLTIFVDIFTYFSYSPIVANSCICMEIAVLRVTVTQLLCPFAKPAPRKKVLHKFITDVIEEREKRDIESDTFAMGLSFALMLIANHEGHQSLSRICKVRKLQVIWPGALRQLASLLIEWKDQYEP